MRRAVSPPAGALAAAIAAARQGAEARACVKSSRGAAVFSGDCVLGVGFNQQPPPWSCRGTDACRRSCGASCVHAEEVAIFDAVLNGGARLLVPGGKPSCITCSRTILNVGLSYVLLFESAWAGCASEVGCCYCEGACRECDIAETCGNGRDACSPDHDRHYGLDESEPRWRRYTAQAFHEATIAHPKAGIVADKETRRG